MNIEIVDYKAAEGVWAVLSWVVGVSYGVGGKVGGCLAEANKNDPG